ncbi:MAG: histidine phosphatase family protein [Chitinophagaceae bacterium]
MRYLLLATVVFLVSCGSQRYYVVRHAEKAIVTKDSAGFTTANPPLSEPGQVRAIVLREELKNADVGYIFSTNYNRTMSTAKPLADLKSINIQSYNPSKDSLDAFIARLKAIKKKSVLVVGHSNTVDDIVNKLTGETAIPGDLKDSDYDNMYIIRKRKGRMEFSQKKYGYPSNPEK